MSFGKHKGIPLSMVPIPYLLWLTVDKTTDKPYERGNYAWVKANDPVLFQQIKRRVHAYITGL